MPHINYEKREIAFKVVYFGPGMSGKTTNLLHIHRALAQDVRGEMLTLDTAEERTLFFDFFPLELGQIAGFGLRFNMYTVPGQVYYEASRRLILDGADGVVFVADSHPDCLAANLRSFRMMEDNLQRTLTLYDGSLRFLWERPVSMGIAILLLVVVTIPIVRAIRRAGAVQPK